MLAGVSEPPPALDQSVRVGTAVCAPALAEVLYISVSRFVKTLAPIFRIVIIMSLTLTLVVNYCDDLNPLDNLRARLNGVRPII